MVYTHLAGALLDLLLTDIISASQKRTSAKKEEYLGQCTKGRVLRPTVAWLQQVGRHR